MSALAEKGIELPSLFHIAPGTGMEGSHAVPRLPQLHEAEKAALTLAGVSLGPPPNLGLPLGQQDL